MRFSVGEKVKVKSKEKEGTITGYKIESYTYQGAIREATWYYVNFAPYQSNYFIETDLESLDNFHDLEFTTKYKFTNKFELGLLNMLIDINLSKRDFGKVKELIKLKQTYKR